MNAAVRSPYESHRGAPCSSSTTTSASSSSSTSNHRKSRSTSSATSGQPRTSNRSPWTSSTGERLYGLVALDPDLAARGHDVRRAAIGHDLGAERAPDRLDLALHLLAHLRRARLEVLQPAGGPLELLLELQHALDAGEVEPQVRRHLLDAAQHVDVALGVQARALRGALGLDQAARLVHAQRLWMHLRQLGRDRDHEH